MRGECSFVVRETIFGVLDVCECGKFCITNRDDTPDLTPQTWYRSMTCWCHVLTTHNGPLVAESSTYKLFVMLQRTISSSGKSTTEEESLLFASL